MKSRGLGDVYKRQLYAPVGLSNDLSWEAGSLSCCCPNPHGRFQSEVCLGCAVCFTPRHSSQFICVRVWGRRVCWWSDCLPRSSRTPPVLVPPRPGKSSPNWCLSPPLLPVWMNVYFLFPWCRTSLPFDFPSVLVV